MTRVRRATTLAGCLALLLISSAAGVTAEQGRGGGPPPPPQPPRAAAPIDLTGYWVSVVTEDWRWRMVTPAKGDFSSVPLTAAGQKLAEAWDPARDEAAGEACKSHGAPGLMRAPGRLHLTWRDDNTLQMEADNGTQTRLFHFAPSKPPEEPPSWQGASVATWEMGGGRGGRGGRGAAAAAPAPNTPPPPRFGNLKVVTTNLRPGYLRKNGVPYGPKTVFTEYWDVYRTPAGQTWLVITNLVNDPDNLQIDWVTSLNFRKEADGSKWDPTPCSARW